jgi:hypothetical protein
MRGVVTILLVGVLGACGEGPLWPYREGDAFSGLIVQRYLYRCADLGGVAEPPDSLLCAAGDTNSASVSVDSFEVQLVLHDGRLPESPSPGYHPWFRGSGTFPLEATVTLRRCVAAGLCEETGGTGNGLMSRTVYYCPVVIDPTFNRVGQPLDCEGRLGDTVVTVTVDLGVGLSRADWQPVVVGEETSDGGMAGDHVYPLTSRLERRSVWLLRPS